MLKGYSMSKMTTAHTTVVDSGKQAEAQAVGKTKQFEYSNLYESESINYELRSRQ